MFYNRRLAKNLDYGLLLAVLVLAVVGLIMIFSATRGNIAENHNDAYFFLKRQIAWLIIGIIGLFMVLNIDYHYFERLQRPIYWANIGFLLVVLLLGERVSGAQSWVRVGLLGVQPSELAKVAVIATLAAHLVRKENLTFFAGLVTPFAHVGLPLVLVVLQRDLGTALVFVVILLAMVYVAGAKSRHLLAIIGTGIAISPLVYFFFLKEYQRERLLSFINPSWDAMGAGYQVMQSRIAVGSGKFLGKGLFHSTQAGLNFLPAHHTDFIFSVVGEELGFVGAVAIVCLYFFIVWRGLKIASQAKDLYGCLLAAGIVSMFLFHILVTVGMTLGLMPVTGIPLPFLSYGGSSLVSSMIGIGILLNVHMRRQKILF